MKQRRRSFTYHVFISSYLAMMKIAYCPFNLRALSALEEVNSEISQQFLQRCGCRNKFFGTHRPFSKLIHHPGRESRELNMDLSDLISVPLACLPPRAHLRCLWFPESEADFTGGGGTLVLSGSSTTF